MRPKRAGDKGGGGCRSGPSARLPRSWEDEACPPHPPAGPQPALQACLCAEAPPGGAGSPGHRSPCKGAEAFLFQGRSFLTVNPSQALRDGAPGVRPWAARCPKWRKSPEPVTFARGKPRGRASQGGDSGSSSARCVGSGESADSSVLSEGRG